VIDWEFTSYCAPIQSFSDEFIVRFEDNWKWNAFLSRRDLKSEFFIKYAKQIIYHKDAWYILKAYPEEVMKAWFAEAIRQGKTFSYHLNEDVAQGEVYKNLMNRWWIETLEKIEL